MAGKRRKSNAGAPSVLDDEKTITKIEEVVLAGGWINEIAKVLGIPQRTVQDWYTRDYRDFRQKIRTYRIDRRLMLAENNIDDVLVMDLEEPIVTMVGVLKDKKGNVMKKVNTHKLKVKADMSKFVAETLGKEQYSKRSEHTGKDGQSLPTPILYVPEDNSDKKAPATDKKN